MQKNVKYQSLNFSFQKSAMSVFIVAVREAKEEIWIGHIVTVVKLCDMHCACSTYLLEYVFTAVLLKKIKYANLRNYVTVRVYLCLCFLIIQFNQTVHSQKLLTIL
jgi:8-oxo-dGTP pyrophosphatase MutT (NUDIX family)